MPAEDTLKLSPGQHDKLGIIYCGVTREGFIAVAGDPHDIADGEEVVFDKVNVSAKRNGSEYTFTRLH